MRIALTDVVYSIFTLLKLHIDVIQSELTFTDLMSYYPFFLCDCKRTVHL